MKTLHINQEDNGTPGSVEDSDGTVLANLTSSTITFPGRTVSGGSVDIVDDTTPKLGGDLDVNAFSIKSLANGDIAITPHGTGNVILDGIKHPQADGTNGQFLVTNGSGQLSFGAGDGVGDMLIATYDPTAVSGDAFAMDEMVEGTTTKILSATERTKLTGIEASATADQTGAQIKTAYEAEADTNAFADADVTKLGAIEASADVTDVTNVTAAGALMDSEVDADIKTLVLPASTTISAFGATLVDDANAAAALTTLGAVNAAVFPSEIIVAGSDEVTAIVTATGVTQFRMPYAMTGTEIRASVGSACSSGTFTVDVNIGGATVLSTKVTIDAGEKTSETAVTAPVLSDTAWANDEIVTVDVDNQGDGTATGLKVTLIGTRSV